MPTFASWLRETRWEKWTYWRWRIGPVISAILDFFAKATVMYLFIIKGVGSLLKRQDGQASGTSYRICPFCRESIHPEAIRCRFCGAEAPPVAATEPRTG